MIKATLKNILDSQQALGIISSRKMPSKPSYWIGKIMSKSKQILEPYFIVHNQKIDQYGEEIKKADGSLDIGVDGNPRKEVNKESESYKKFLYEIEELQKVEVLFDGINKISLSSLSYKDREGKDVEFEIEPQLLSVLDWMFELGE